MSLSISVKSALAYILHSSGLVARKVARRAGNGYAILMYHRVLPAREALGVQAGMYVEPVTLEEHFKYLREHFALAPLSELLSGGQANTGSLPARPMCAITFDDGWHDVYRHAFPLIKKYETPVTVFLPTGYIGTNDWFWTDRLSYLYLKARGRRNATGSGGDSDIPMISRLEWLMGLGATGLEEAISMLKAHRSEDIEKALEGLSRRLDLAPAPPGRSFLSWEEVREMFRSGLVSFGSHTASHRILTDLSDEEMRGELERSRDKLLDEKVADPSFISFCYPNGDYDEAVVRMVADAGYHAAVTTRGGWNHSGANRFLLRRIPIHQDMASQSSMFGCRVAGVI